MLEDKGRRMASEALEAAFHDPVPEDWQEDVTSHEFMKELRGKLSLLTDRDLKIALPHILNDILHTVFEADGTENVDRVTSFLSRDPHDPYMANAFDNSFKEYSARQAEAIYLWLLAMADFYRELYQITNVEDALDIEDALKYWHTRAQAGGLG
ncbi:MAG TPA: hypothetical protein VGM37_02115 [Armatimonadota bacterium]